MFSLSKELRLYIAFGLFIGFLVGMNVLGSKIIPIGPFSASVAIFIVPLSFLITDTVEEVYGKKLAKQFVVAGMITLIVMLLFIALFVFLPAHSRFTQNEAYTTIFGASARIMIASIIAFTLSQFHDVWSFGLLKKATHGKFLWLRTNVSTILSQTIDTFVFMFVAFYMITPNFTALFILQLAIPYLIFKILWGTINSPLVYLGANFLRGGKKN